MMVALILPLILLMTATDAFGKETCDPNPCENGGVCGILEFHSDLGQTVLQGPTCNCQEGYIGRRCEMKSDAGFSLEPSDYVMRVPRGSNLEVTCHYAGDMRGKIMSFIPPDFIPIHVGDTQQPAGHIKVEGMAENSAKMYINGVRDEDLGLYRCMVGARTKGFWIQADDNYGAPSIEIIKGDGDVISRGDPTYMLCKITNFGGATNPTLRWYDPSGFRVTSMKITDGKFLQYNIEEKGLVLMIRDSEPGRYSCMALDSETGSVTTAYAELLVTDEPLIHIPRQQTINSNNSEIRCFSKDPLQWNVSMYRHGTRLTYGTKYIKTYKGVKILNLGPEDAGVYTCRTENPKTGQIEQLDIQVDVVMD